MRKKAALNVSIEAIVILILAITILGLGLTFIRTMFGKTTGQLGEVSQQIEEQIVNEIKNTNERLAFSKTTIEIKKAETKEMYFGIRNDLDDDYTFTMNGIGTLEDSYSISPGKWNTVESTIACYDAIENTGKEGATGDPTSENNHITFKTFGSRMIKKDSIEVLVLKVSASSTAAKTTYSCAMVICEPTGVGCSGDEYARKDFYVKVV